MCSLKNSYPELQKKYYAAQAAYEEAKGTPREGDALWAMQMAQQEYAHKFDQLPRGC